MSQTPNTTQHMDPQMLLFGSQTMSGPNTSTASMQSMPSQGNIAAPPTAGHLFGTALPSPPFDLAALSALIRKLNEADQLHKLIQRVWVFEEDLWLSCLNTAPLSVNNQLAVISDQLCVILPILGQINHHMPDVSFIAQVYVALTRQLGITWQQCQTPPQDDATEGRARCLLFLLKTMHLHHLLRQFTSIEQLLLLSRAVPPQVSLVRLVRMLGRLQQIFVQTSRQPDILLLWRHGLLLRTTQQEQELFLRQCLLDVPEDEQDLFTLLAGVLHFPEEALLSLQAVLGHAQDFQIQILALLLRKPSDVIVDSYELAGCRPQINRFSTADPNMTPVSTTTSVRTASFSVVPTSISTRSGGPDVRLTIIRQPPKETIKDKILNPIPGIRVDGLAEDDDSAYVIRAYVIRFGELEEIEDGLHGCVLHQVSTSRIVNFKKLKVKHTCKQLNCTRLCIKFQLMRQNELGAFEGLNVETTSNPIEVYSHTSQLHSTTKEDGHLTVSGLVPDRGPLSGGTTVAILAADLVPTPEMVVMFGSLKLRPVHTEVGWAIFQTPPYNAAFGNPICVTLSLDGGETLCETGSNFTYAHI
eukprot:TRINITY_DN165_c0_g1_i12.p1 TRINITY_DN165_c0_g1~~TRINITY_DN165_c0_g1_i12.p1  ORF type:complete len:614 (+),score=98.31 TRINITY_DN165_c0_g1_i12:88-1842(+)